MKIIHLSTNEDNSGAAKAALKIHKQCLLNNYDSSLLVQNKSSTSEKTIDVSRYRSRIYSAKINSRINALPLKFYYSRKKYTWSSALLSYIKVKNISLIKSADIIALYWVCEGLLSIKEVGKLLNLNKPIIWRLSDMWPLTGGCHYSFGCDKYEQSCGECSQLHSNYKYDLSSVALNRKKILWKNHENLTLVAPSLWMYNCIKRSTIFKNAKIKLIPTGVNTKKFKPKIDETFKDIKGIGKDKSVILFGSINPYKDERKGGAYLLKALNIIRDKDKLKLLIFGNENKNFLNNFDTLNVGMIRSKEILASYYSHADVFVAPSIEENLANTVLESMSCGTPVVAFKIGGMSDIIDHKVNGYLAEPYNIEDLSKGIEWIINNKNIREIKKQARKKIEEFFSLEQEIEKYKDLYEELNDKK